MLIPGLPDDIARECLVRVPYENFSNVLSVSKGWKGQIEMPDFFLHRKAVGCSRVVVVMAQARVDPNKKTGSAAKISANPVYRLTLCEPETGRWCELPGFSDKLPMFCQLVAVGSDLVVMGGWDPYTWAVSKLVLIYNFVSASWRRGADMPGCRRSFFGCASDSDRTVYVAGGHNQEKNALRSVMAYDVAKDEWVQLPDMARERDECKAILQGGKLHVIGGYQTDMQGRFENTAEAFDIANWQWDHVEDFLKTGTCPRTCVDGGDGKLYMCQNGEVVALEDAKWRTVAELPVEVQYTSFMMTWQGNLLVIGSLRFSEPHTAYMLDLKSYAWTKVEMPEDYSGHVQSGCCLEL